MAVTKTEFLYWFRDNPNRPITTDVEWAAKRFESKFGINPTTILVNEKEEGVYKGLRLSFNLETYYGIQEGYLGVA